MPKIKSIKMVAGGTELTVEVDGEILKAKTYWDIDGKDKVEIQGKTYEYDGGFELKQPIWVRK